MMPFDIRSIVVAVVLGATIVPGDADPPRVRANDNRAPAGTRRGDTLVLDLDVRLGRWYPEADDGPYVDVPAFAVVGAAPEIPGPLIRVPAGTVLDLTVRNSLADSGLILRGLGTHPASERDTVRIAPGASHRFRFSAGAPGTYLYRATVGAQSDRVEREQLAGAFVVDPPGATPDDRIFVMNIWGNPQDSTAASPSTYRNALAINGKAWPHSERQSFTVGDSVRWRWLNASVRNHPMHLHGFYFEVRTKGSGLVDTVIPPARRRLAVTEEMRPFQTMTLVWSPSRPGNWLFHCHISFHVVTPGARYGVPAGHPEDEHMAGLVLGLDVREPPKWVEAPRSAARQIAMDVDERPRWGRSPRAIGVTLTGTGGARTARGAGPPLIVTRDQPTDVTVRNHLAEPTAIHWHGIELESFSDGVAGWSGSSRRLAPMIAAGDSFTARLTLPRAGTFMYHTHLNDLDQLTAGLYGGIVVLQPGQTFDPARDHLFVLGWDGLESPLRIVSNGDSTPPPLELARGVPHRLRFVNIGPAQRLRFELWRDTTLVSWRRLAADGAALDAEQTRPVPAFTLLPVGTTADMEFLPPDTGTYRLTMGLLGKPFVTQVFVVR